MTESTRDLLLGGGIALATAVVVQGLSYLWNERSRAKDREHDQRLRTADHQHDREQRNAAEIRQIFRGFLGAIHRQALMFRLVFDEVQETAPELPELDSLTTEELAEAATQSKRVLEQSNRIIDLLEGFAGEGLATHKAQLQEIRVACGDPPADTGEKIISLLVKLATMLGEARRATWEGSRDDARDIQDRASGVLVKIDLLAHQLAREMASAMGYRSGNAAIDPPKSAPAVPLDP